MKRAVIAIAMIISFAWSQARLGYTEYEIRSEAPSISWKSFIGNSSGSKMIRADFYDYIVFHAFSASGKCYMTMVYPITEQEITRRVNLYDEIYIKIDELKWLDRKIIIELVYSEEVMGYVFIYTPM